MAELTLAEVKNFCRVDTNDDDNMLNSLLNASKSYVIGGIGEDADFTDDRVKNIQCIIINDMYNNREQMLQVKYYNNTRWIYHTMVMQLKLEMDEESETEESETE